MIKLQIFGSTTLNAHSPKQRSRFSLVFNIPFFLISLHVFRFTHL